MVADTNLDLAMDNGDNKEFSFFNFAASFMSGSKEYSTFKSQTVLGLIHFRCAAYDTLVIIGARHRKHAVICFKCSYMINISDFLDVFPIRISANPNVQCHSVK